MFVHDEPEPATAAELLRSAREQAGLSQSELGARAGVPRTMVSAYERDLRQPSLPTLRHLVVAAGFELRVRLVRRPDTDEVLRALEEQFADPGIEHGTADGARENEARRAARERQRRAAEERARRHQRPGHGAG